MQSVSRTCRNAGRQLPEREPSYPPAGSRTRCAVLCGRGAQETRTAKIVTGDVHHRKAIWRIDQTAPEGCYTLDNTGRISEMRDRAFAEAREQLPDLKRHFFGTPADQFVPFHTL
jgi:hypothetical protein